MNLCFSSIDSRPTLSKMRCFYVSLPALWLPNFAHWAKLPSLLPTAPFSKPLGSLISTKNGAPHLDATDTGAG